MKMTFRWYGEGNTAADLQGAELSVGFQVFSTVQIAEKNCITA